MGVLVFPGSNCDRDCFHVTKNVYQYPTNFIWHKDNFSIQDYDLIILPGGFSYGDYLRAGAVARFSAAMQSIIQFAESGKPVLGICNGFQILCEASLLPGALVLNKDLLFKCRKTPLKGHSPRSAYLSNIGNKEFALPIAHGEGSYFIDDIGYQELLENEQIIFSYLDNPNGSYKNIGGITNKNGNVIGMMPHPERASETILGNSDGKIVMDSILQAI